MALAQSGFAITPSDTVDLVHATTGGIVVGSAGTLTVTFLHGPTVQLTAPAGWLPIVVSRVWSTGTAASALSGLI